MGKYKIKYEDMYELTWTFKNDMDFIMQKIDLYKGDLEEYLNTSAMAGQTADAVYNYFKDVHYVLLDTIKQIAQAFLDNIAAYKCGYYSIDLSTAFVLVEEGIEESRDKLNEIYGIFTQEYEKVNAALNDIDSISGVEHYDHPSNMAIPLSHDGLNSKLTNLDTDIAEFEASTVTALDNTIETLMGLFMKSIESLYLPKTVAPNTYEAGSFAENPYVFTALAMNEILQEQHDNNVETLDAIWEQESVWHEEAMKRETMGIWKAIGGVVLIVGGVICIVGSAGAATPLVVGSWVAGGGTILFGTADLLEGGQDIYHGSTGNIDTSSFNYIRDTVFQGNQTAYDITEEIFSFAAGAMNPLCEASQAGKLTLRSGSFIVGKELVGEGASIGAQKLTEQFTDDPGLQMIAGFAASKLVGHVGDKVDARFNVSGMHPSATNTPSINVDPTKPDVDVSIGSNNANPDVNVTVDANNGSPNVDAAIGSNTSNPDAGVTVDANAGSPNVDVAIGTNNVNPDVDVAVNTNNAKPDVDVAVNTNAANADANVTVYANNANPDANVTVNANTANPDANVTVNANTANPDVSINDPASNTNTTHTTNISPEMEEKILRGQRKIINGKESKTIIGGHSPEINDANPNYAIEVLKENADGTKKVKYIKQLPDGDVSKIKNYSVLFPDSWSNEQIIESIKTVGDGQSLGTRASDGAHLFRDTVNGVEIEVMKIGNDVIAGYPTGGMTNFPEGFVMNNSN